MTDMTLRIIPILMSDEVKSKMHLMLDGNSTYEEIVVYLAKKALKQIRQPFPTTIKVGKGGCMIA